MHSRRYEYLPTYGYGARRAEASRLVRPMAEAGDPAVCPACGTRRAAGVRAPALRSLDPGLRNALDAGARSADAPPVVSAVPGRSRRATRTTTDPATPYCPAPDWRLTDA